MNSASITLIAALSLTLCGVASAQVPQPDTRLQNQAGTIVVPSTSSSFNQQGFNLPSVPRSSGQDIVRGSGGISCQSAVGSNGPVFDMGVIGTNDIYSRDSAALYGRITVPLGKKPKRIDCSKLYELEVQRLKLEIQMMRAGAGAAALFGRNSDLMKAEFEKIHQADVKIANLKVPEIQSEQAEPPEPVRIGAPDRKDAKPRSDYYAMRTLDIGSETKPPEQARKRSASDFAHIPSIFVRPESKARPAPQREAILSSPSVTAERENKSDTLLLSLSGEPDYEEVYYAQLGAFSTMENSRRALADYAKDFPTDLPAYEAVVKPLKRGEKTLYLLQAGPFSKSRTKTLCKAVGNDCYPTRRR